MESLPAPVVSSAPAPWRVSAICAPVFVVVGDLPVVKEALAPVVPVVEEKVER